MRIFPFLGFFIILLISCNTDQEQKPIIPEYKTQIKLDQKTADFLVQLPLKCLGTQYPYKLGQVLGGESELQSPKEMHPAFYGCFDWHSSVHGHWMLVRLLKQFPQLENAVEIRSKLSEHLSKENIEKELLYFNRPTEKSFERTYGWAWLLKLAEELRTWEDPLGNELADNLEPLTSFIVSKYIDFLPKLVYPIRVGEHPNTGFGLAFAYDYAQTMKMDSFKQLIVSRAKDFYKSDENCPISWEPGGFDFLSPCLEEADIMRRVLSKEDFRNWLQKFLPQLGEKNFALEPAKVRDRSDGKLVHLDGANFSRAWVLYGIALSQPEYGHLIPIADAHFNHSINDIVDGSYSGEHWLASFALYALSESQK